MSEILWNNHQQCSAKKKMETKYEFWRMGKKKNKDHKEETNSRRRCKNNQEGGDKFGQQKCMGIMKRGSSQFPWLIEDVTGNLAETKITRFSTFFKKGSKSITFCLFVFSWFWNLRKEETSEKLKMLRSTKKTDVSLKDVWYLPSPTKNCTGK